MTEKKLKSVSETHKIKDGVKRTMWHLTGSLTLFITGIAVAADAYIHGDIAIAAIASCCVLVGGYWLYRTNSHISNEIHDSTKAYFIMKA